MATKKKPTPPAEPIPLTRWQKFRIGFILFAKPVGKILKLVVIPLAFVFAVVIWTLIKQVILAITAGMDNK